MVPLILVAVLGGWQGQAAESGGEGHADHPVVIRSDGWELVGDLRVPATAGSAPVVLLLNQAGGDRSAYEGLAAHLAGEGIASLRLDLRGHGESTNLGTFMPGESRRDPFIWDAERDVIAARDFLEGRSDFDGSRVGVVGASYSGEEMAEAARIQGFARAYVALSPGSFSEESIQALDRNRTSWLLVATEGDRFLTDITRSVSETSSTADVYILPGASHGTNMLGAHPSLIDSIGHWLSDRLRTDAPGFPIAAPTFLAVVVPDIEQAAAWYSETLQLREVSRTEGEDGAYSVRLLTRDGFELELLWLANAEAPVGSPSQGLFKVGFYVEDVDATLSWLQVRGVDTDGGVFTDSVLQARSFVFRDPFGNRLQVFERCSTPC